MNVSGRAYFVYILANKTRTVLYTGVTNDLKQRIVEHFLNRNNPKTFTGRYNCYWLLYHETHAYVEDAISREKEIKKWGRQKKHELIASFNPKWESLNWELFGEWPPAEIFHRKDL